MLSRLPTECSESDDPSEDAEIDALYVKQLENLPVFRRDYPTRNA